MRHKKSNRRKGARPQGGDTLLSRGFTPPGKQTLSLPAYRPDGRLRFMSETSRPPAHCRTHKRKDMYIVVLLMQNVADE